MEKSHITLEQQMCIICAKEFDTGALLMDLRLRPKLDHYTTTGTGICPECQKLLDDEFLALIEVDPGRSVTGVDGTLLPKDAYRTGEIVWLLRTVAEEMFATETGEYPMVFVDPEIVAHLHSLAEKESV